MSCFSVHYIIVCSINGIAGFFIQAFCMIASCHRESGMAMKNKWKYLPSVADRCSLSSVDMKETFPPSYPCGRHGRLPGWHSQQYPAKQMDRLPTRLPGPVLVRWLTQLGQAFNHVQSGESRIRYQSSSGVSHEGTNGMVPSWRLSPGRFHADVQLNKISLHPVRQGVHPCMKCLPDERGEHCDLPGHQCDLVAWG
jgi:hypothetical protein